MQLENNTLYYIYDPMCSWCYAFEQALCLLQEQLPDGLLFKSILGGLAPDTKTPMSIETQAMVQHAWHQIEKTVENVKFNFDFWNKNTPYRSTYPACRAILAAVNQSPEFEGVMRQAIQQAYYQAAKNPSLSHILIDCARELALDISQFSDDLMSLTIDEQLTEQLQFSRTLAVNSYPSLRLILNDKKITIPIDYNDVEFILSHIQNSLDNKATGSK